jgi:hypothetical protein
MVKFSKEDDLTWAYDLGNIVELAYFISIAVPFNRPKDVIYFFEKPWKWSYAWRIYQEFKQSPEFEEYKNREHIPDWVLNKLYEQRG